MRLDTTYGQSPNYMPTVAIDNLALLTLYHLRRYVQLDFPRGQYMLRWERFLGQSHADRGGRASFPPGLALPPELLGRAAAETAALQGEVVTSASGISRFIAHVADRAALRRQSLLDHEELVIIVGGGWQGMHGWNPLLGKGAARTQWATWCASVHEPFPATYDYFINFLDATLAALRNDFPGRVRTGPVGRDISGLGAQLPTATVWHVLGGQCCQLEPSSGHAHPGHRYGTGHAGGG